ncbi:MAG TPA: hypothetical protein VGF95_15800 [Solirubrobacteraceae bacterium]|jgi:hypothetical protein
MPYTAAEARGQLLESLAAATAELSHALAALGDAHELLDERLAERLEDELFRPIQRAYGQARRAYADFAGEAGEEPAQAPPGAPSHGAKAFVEAAVEAASRADATLAELQDSMLPIEVGDAQLRARLANVRELIASVRHNARELLRVLGR